VLYASFACEDTLQDYLANREGESCGFELVAELPAFEDDPELWPTCPACGNRLSVVSPLVAQVA
jgi:hypothetical protein